MWGEGPGLPACGVRAAGRAARVWGEGPGLTAEVLGICMPLRAGWGAKHFQLAGACRGQLG